ncbi:MAG: sensor histidine kinase [Prevotellaceae bacterium]|jgi:two-component system phosphate regulon sensor histidine kinase PhoR|nr:sensor histidine kinase [Prevotellaceae bacterium]
MKFFSHRIIAIIIALLTVAGGSLVAIFFAIHFHIGILIGLCILILILIYFLVYATLQRFVINKLTPIYKTIYNTENIKIKKDLKSNVKGSDIIERVNRDVVDWAAKKTEEISRLSELERYRKEFLGNVSHELKTPIFNIQGFILTLLDGGLNDPDINRKYLERTEKSVERLINIMQELDVINRIETGQMQLNKTTFNIVSLVEELFESFELTAENRQIDLRLHAPVGGKIMVYADRKRISQVLTNLIANSINYGREGGETVVLFSHLPNRILVEVKDTGIGSSAEALPRIFERFYRVDKHRSREHGGSGLGLAIVKHFIEAHDQSINVRSELGKGTTFAFTLDKSK